jgi:hypothetical protein
LFRVFWPVMALSAARAPDRLPAAGRHPGRHGEVADDFVAPLGRPQVDRDEHADAPPGGPVDEVPLTDGQVQAGQQHVAGRPLAVDVGHPPGVLHRQAHEVEPVARLVDRLLGGEAGRVGQRVTDALDRHPVPGLERRDRDRCRAHGQVVHGHEVERRSGPVALGVGGGDRLEHPDGAEPVAGPVVEVEKEDVTPGMVGQPGPQRRPLGHGHRFVEQVRSGTVQDLVVGALDDLQGLVLRRSVAENGAEGLAQAGVVERALDPGFDVHAPRPRVEQMDRVGRGVVAVPDPLTVEVRPVVTLAAPEQADEVLPGAHHVVQRSSRHRVAGRLVGPCAEW